MVLNYYIFTRSINMYLCIRFIGQVFSISRKISSTLDCWKVSPSSNTIIYGLKLYVHICWYWRCIKWNTDEGKESPDQPCLARSVREGRGSDTGQSAGRRHSAPRNYRHCGTAHCWSREHTLLRPDLHNKANNTYWLWCGTLIPIILSIKRWVKI